MNKRDFCTLFVSNAISVLLVLEYYTGLEFAVNMLAIWTLVNIIICSAILRNYIKRDRYANTGKKFIVRVKTFPYIFKSYREAELFCNQNGLNSKEIHECIEEECI